MNTPSHWVEAEIENRIFRDVRELLLKPRREAELANPFHFHVLDSHRQQAVSRGYNLEDKNPVIELERAKSFAACVREVAEPLSTRRQVSIIDVLRALNEDGELQHNANFFRSFVSVEGQPLDKKKPSRLEQFLTIRTAYANGKLDDIGRSIRPVETSNFYVIDDYLGDNPELDETYTKARKRLRGKSTSNESSGAFYRHRGICTIETAPFIAAEHLEMFNLSRVPRYGDWLETLRQQPLGLAFLPLRVLGQYRAAGVWMYQGAFNAPRNKALKDHLVSLTQPMTHDAEAWLAPAIGNAMLSAGSVLLLRAVSQFDDLLCRSLWTCELARRAVSNLWYTKEGTCRCRNGVPVEDDVCFEGLVTAKESKASVANNSSKAHVILRIGEAGGQENISSVLGFDTVGFECPFVPENSKLAYEVKRAECLFSDIGSPLIAIRQRAEARRNES